jgi:hypothetical protein
MKRPRHRSPNAPTRALALLAAILAACGGGSGSNGPLVLFDGPAAALRPHERGRSSLFDVRISQGDRDITDLRTSHILEDGPDGRFVFETRSEAGTSHRIRGLDRGDRIEIEAIQEGDTWRALDPPPVIVQSPLIAGETRETRFLLTLQASVESGGSAASRALTFEGRSARTPRAWETIVVDGYEIPALAIDVRATAEATAPHRAETPSLRLTMNGSEYLAPGLGLLREVLSLQIDAADKSVALQRETERRFGPSGPSDFLP